MSLFEHRVQRFFEQQGWAVQKSGWPDFLCTRHNEDGKLELIVVEAKTDGDRLRPNQEFVLDALAEAGIKVYVAKERPQYANEPGGFLNIDWSERSKPHGR